MISNPELNKAETLFSHWKKVNGIIGKPKRIVVRGGQVSSDENVDPLAKIVFMKDSDIENSEFEEVMSSWIIRF